MKGILRGEVVPALLQVAPELGFGVWFTLKDLASLDELLPIVDEWLKTAADWQLESLCKWAVDQRDKAAALVQTLLNRLADARPATRFAIIDALVAVDPSRASEAIRAIEPLLDHEIESVRQKATELRARITSLQQA